MIGKAAEAQERTYSGVHFEVLVPGPESMVTKMKYQDGNLVPPHAHPNVQSGYVLSGRYRLTAGDTQTTLEPGDSYSIPRDLEHSIEVLEPGEVIDVFTPPRADYV